MNSIIIEQLQQCHSCQINTRDPVKTPLTSTPVPKQPWQDVSLDMFGPLPSNEHILVARCNLSRYPDAKIVKSTSAEDVLPKLSEIYNNYGNPKVHKSDNGPPFNSATFKQFSEERGINIKHTPPYHPQSNEAETFMKPLKKAVKIALENKIPTHTAVNDLLSAYRSTPNKSAGLSPGNIMFRGGYRTIFPHTTPSDEIVTEACDVDRYKKEKRNSSVNESRVRHYKEIEQGDMVLVKRPFTKRKWDSLYEKEPYIIQSHKNLLFQLYRYSDGRVLQRHLDDIKPYHSDTLVPFQTPKPILRHSWNSPERCEGKNVIRRTPPDDQPIINTPDKTLPTPLTTPAITVTPPLEDHSVHMTTLTVPKIQLKQINDSWQIVNDNMQKRQRRPPSRLKDYNVALPTSNWQYTKKGGDVISTVEPYPEGYDVTVKPYPEGYEVAGTGTREENEEQRNTRRHERR